MTDDYHIRKAERTRAYQENLGYVRVPCVACNGSGRYDHDGSPKCGQCNGTGKMRVKKTLLPQSKPL